MTAAVRRSGLLWLIAAGLFGAALALYVGVVRQLPELAAPVSLPWVLLTVGFFLAEVGVVHLHFRHEAHSYSLSELPLVAGLFLAGPLELVTALIVGEGAALLYRRQSFTKLSYNLGHFALGACLAVVIFRGLGGGGDPLVARNWGAALLAAVAVCAMSTIAVFVAISVSERKATLDKLPEEFGLALLATTGSASLGLIGVGVAWQSPAAVLLLVVPVGTFFLAYRGYVRQRQEHDNLEFLYDSARILDRAPDLAAGASELLRNACVTFRAELAQLAVLSERDSGLALLVTATPEGVETTGPLALAALEGFLRDALHSEKAALHTLPSPVALAHGHELRHAMAGALIGGTRTRGAMVLGNRLGATSTFSGEDLRLFQTMLTQVGVSLENGRLGDMLQRATERAERERDKSLTLQRALLPSVLPSVANASIAVRYVPGSTDEEVGGDWYDVVRLPCGKVGVVVGDVVGHDLAAATVMGYARSALRAYAAEGHPPAVLIQRLNHLLSRSESEFTGTCCYLEFDAARATVSVVRAGHPPPLYISPDGCVRLLDTDANLPLGVDPDATYREKTVPMPPASTLLLYTDGLVESKTMSLQEGLDRLVSLPGAALDQDVEGLADHLLHHAHTGQGTDDVALLVLRHEAG